jgi:hypothetical protein
MGSIITKRKTNVFNRCSKTDMGFPAGKASQIKLRLTKKVRCAKALFFILCQGVWDVFKSPPRPFPKSGEGREVRTLGKLSPSCRREKGFFYAYSSSSSGSRVSRCLV